MNYKRAKFFVIAFMLVSVLFFTSDFQLIDIEKTAIVVALGVDKKDELYNVTVQIAVPQSGDFSSGNGVAVIEAEGRTVYEAIETTAQQSGWYPELSFCNMIVFGEKAVDDNFVQLVDYFFVSGKFQNSAILAVAEGTAEEVLKSATSLDDISSFALQKILLRNINRANTVTVTDVREFCAGNRSVSDVCFLPYIKRIKTDDNPEDADTGGSQGAAEGTAFANDGAWRANMKESLLIVDSGKKPGGETVLLSGNGSAGGGSADGKGAGGGGQVVFDAGSSLVFSQGKRVCEFDSEQTLFYNMIYKQVHESFVSVSFSEGNKKVNSLIAVLNNKASVKLTADNGLPVLKITLKIVCRREETDAYERLDRLTGHSEMSEKEKNAVKEKGEKILRELVDLSKSNNCDIFKLKEYVYRYMPGKYAALKDSLLSSFTAELKVNCVNYN